jgi:DNA-binding transcriptional regulator YiaG
MYRRYVRSTATKKRRISFNRISAQQFRDARVFGGLTREQAADLLGVCVRTIGHWETGRARPSYAAFKLLRVYRHGEFPDPAWSDYRIVRGQLVTPENRTFKPADLAWLSLLVARARLFSERFSGRNPMSVGGPEGRRALGLSLIPSKHKHPVSPTSSIAPISSACDTVAGERDVSPGQPGVPLFAAPAMATAGGHARSLGGAA